MQKVKLSDYGFNILQLETQANCNMACSFCPYPLKDDKSSKYSMAEIKKILDQIDIEDEYFQYVTFSQYNEPLLDSRIFEILEYTNMKNIKTLFITNGLLLNKDKNVDGLLNTNPKVKISLQVLDQNKHKDARGLNMELDEYVNTIITFCEKVKNSKLDVTLDLGCNFNENIFKYYSKKILGLQVGDPSMPDNLKKTLVFFSKYLNLFVGISDEHYKDNISNLLNKIKNNDISSNYLNQEGYQISKNIILKIKPFHYGRKIQDFHPINDNFSCNSNIIGIIADGNVVPCCTAYDDSISLGNIKKISLFEMLQNNLFLKNLREKGGKKHTTCKKCFGDPTKRGAFVRNMINYVRP